MMSVATFDVSVLNPIFDFVLKAVDKTDQEDVKQDSIVRILTAVAEGKVQKDIFNFSHTVIRRTVYDYYRRKNNKIVQHSMLVNFCDGADEEQGSTVDFFSSQVEENGYELTELKNDYLANIDVFTNQERKIIDFLLLTDDGMDMKPTEISNHLGLNKSHASRAMQKLKRVCQA